MGVGTLFGWKKSSDDAAEEELHGARRRGARWRSASTSRSASGSASRPSSGRRPSTAARWARRSRRSTPSRPVLGFSLAVFNAAVIVQEFVAPLPLALQDGRREDARRSSGTRASCPASSTRWPRCRRAGAVATAGTSSTSASSSCSSASPGKSWTVDKETSMKPGDTLPGRALDHQVRRPAHGGRQQQAHDLRRREGLRGRQGGRQALAGEVHLQEDARLADHRGRDVPLDSRRPLSRRREHQPARRRSRRSRST